MIKLKLGMDTIIYSPLYRAEDMFPSPGDLIRCKVIALTKEYAIIETESGLEELFDLSEVSRDCDVFFKHSDGPLGYVHLYNGPIDEWQAVQELLATRRALYAILDDAPIEVLTDLLSQVDTEVRNESDSSIDNLSNLHSSADYTYTGS